MWLGFASKFAKKCPNFSAARQKKGWGFLNISQNLWKKGWGGFNKGGVFNMNAPVCINLKESGRQSSNRGLSLFLLSHF